MRPTSFLPAALRQRLQRHQIATLAELKQALGTEVALTVLRKLRELDYLTSYSHAGRYYTLRAIARFDSDGLWSHDRVWFSRHGTLLATAQHFVEHGPQGYFAQELASALHVQVLMRVCEPDPQICLCPKYFSVMRSTTAPVCCSLKCA